MPYTVRAAEGWPAPATIASPKPSLPLLCHPGAANAAVGSVLASASLSAGGEVVFSFTLEGDLSAVRIPAPAQAGRADGLWQHTCFEAFVAAANTPAYVELNFSPSGQWAAYAFEDYRTGMAPMEMAAPRTTVRRSPDRLQLDAILDVDVLPGLARGGSWRIGLSAVIEGDDGGLTYWALHHGPGIPDFHAREGFVLPLAGVVSR